MISPHPWNNLRKAWRAYKEAERKGDHDKMVEEARKIQAAQKILGVPASKFPGLPELSELIAQ